MTNVRCGKFYHVYLLYTGQDKTNVDVAYLELKKLQLEAFYDSLDVSWGDSTSTIADDAFRRSTLVGAFLSDAFFRDDQAKSYLDTALKRSQEESGRDVVGLLLNLTEGEATKKCPLLNSNRVKLVSYKGGADYSRWAREIRDKSRVCSKPSDSVTEDKLLQTCHQNLNVKIILHDMRRFPDSAEVQAESLVKLQECALKGDNQTIMLQEDGIVFVAKILATYKTNHNIYRYGLGTIACMCFRRDDIRRVAGNCGVVSSVIHAFDHFIDDEDVLQEACACVTNLSMDKQNRQQFLAESVACRMANVIKQKGSHLLLLRWSYSAFWAISKNCPEGISQFLDCQGIELLINAMDHRITSPKTNLKELDSILHAHACRLATVVASVGEVRLELIEKGMLEKCRQVQLAFPKTDSAHKAAGATIEALLGQEGVELDHVEIMLRLTGDAAKLHWLLRTGMSVFHCSAVQCYVLSSLFFLTESTRDEMASFGGFQYLVHVMTSPRYLDNAEIQEKTCSCLATFCRAHRDNKQRATNCGALIAVIDTMKRFLYHKQNANPKLFQEALAAMVNMTSGIAENQVTAAKRSVIGLVLRIMETFEHDLELTRWGAALLATVCNENEENIRRAEKQSVISRLVHTWQCRMGDEVTVLWVSKATARMCAVNEMIDKFCQQGALELVQEATALYSGKDRSPIELSLRQCMHLLLKEESADDQKKSVWRNLSEKGLRFTYNVQVFDYRCRSQ
ncbi:uncharacterized protein [Oscarella lobularis]|uniref:uncharacterized protein isoform X2 n=1 Tax=Oscarella lobularis TaxID=121494 RepID=UPI003313F44D